MGARKPLVAYGTPAENPVVAAMLDQFGWSVDADKIVLGSKHFAGDSLVLVAAHRHPQHHDLPVLLYSGSSPEVIDGVNALFHGPTQWVVGRKVGQKFDVVASGRIGDLELDPHAVATDADDGKKHAHWGYEGDHGTEHWGELDPAYAACKEGVEQSPIDLTGAVEGKGFLGFAYQDSHEEVVNNGHAIEVVYDAGSTVTFAEEEYELLQFHFHTPSEHAVDGELLPMEVHLVHRSAEGHFLVLGLVFEEGAADPVIDEFAADIPLHMGESHKGTRIHAGELISGEQSWYHYPGSFTTPPCTEGVKWFVATKPRTASAGQIERFREAAGANNRPTMPFGDRTLEVWTW